VTAVPLKPGQVLDQRFRPILAGLCLLYAGIAVSYALALPMIMDEFQGAYDVLQLESGIPYRDVMPYKTVLGYYVQLLPVALSDDPWNRLILVRLAMVVINAALLYLAAVRLARHVARPAVLAAVAMLVSMSTFLEHGGAVRVDMLTSWCGLFSLLFLLDRRAAAAGLLAGISFLVSQKGVYYMASGGFALGLHWALGTRDRAGLVAVLRFTAAALAPIVLYVALFGLLASFHEVVHRVFFAPVGIAVHDMYDLRSFWFQTVLRNPAFYGMALLGLGVLFARRGPSTPEGARAGLLFSFATSLLVLCVLHRQPWPYFFVLLIPTCAVLIAFLLDAEWAAPRRPTVAVVAVVLVLGVAFPLVRRVPVVLARDSWPQRESVALAEQLIGPDETYLAGVAMVSTRTHVSHQQLGWLDQRRLATLRQADAAALIDEIARSRLRLLIGNYRLEQLPGPLREYLGRTYVRVHGNLFLYGPRVAAGAAPCPLLLSGTFTPRSADGSAVEIDGRTIAPGASVALAAGSHRCSASAEFRLVPVVADVDLDPTVPPDGLFSSAYSF
jgi:hypothetical protein